MFCSEREIIYIHTYTYNISNNWYGNSLYIIIKDRISPQKFIDY